MELSTHPIIFHNENLLSLLLFSIEGDTGERLFTGKISRR